MTRKWPSSVAVWVVLLGLYSAINGAVAMKNWDAYATGTRTYYGVSLGAGAAAVGYALWLLIRRGLGSGARWGVSVAVGVLAINQVAGLIANTILCFTPG